MSRILAAILLSMLIAATPFAAEPPEAAEQQQVLAAVKEIQNQQAQIADNQAKIEAKMAELAETIRVARIFAGRAGK